VVTVGEEKEEEEGGNGAEGGRVKIKIYT